MKAQLTTLSIDKAVVEAEKYLGQRRIDKKDLIRILLNLEETLLFFQRCRIDSRQTGACTIDSAAAGFCPSG